MRLRERLLDSVVVAADQFLASNPTFTPEQLTVDLRTSTGVLVNRFVSVTYSNEELQEALRLLQVEQPDYGDSARGTVLKQAYRYMLTAITPLGMARVGGT